MHMRANTQGTREFSQFPARIKLDLSKPSHRARERVTGAELVDRKFGDKFVGSGLVDNQVCTQPCVSIGNSGRHSGAVGFA